MPHKTTTSPPSADASNAALTNKVHTEAGADAEGAVAPRRATRRIVGRVLPAALTVAMSAAACGGGTINEVADGSYLSLVPSVDQFNLDVAGELPGGLATLSEQGIDQIEVDISGDSVTVRLDGVEAALLRIIDRVEITDREGSGPFRAAKQILVLSDTPLVLGGLTMAEPVIWPGSFEASPVIAIKPRSSEERGPDVSCDADEPCLLLSSGVDPSGSYADANDPQLEENPIDSILIDDEHVGFTLDSGDTMTISADGGTFTRACGLSENRVWDLSAELGLAIDDPVLIHTLCPSTPGAAIQLVIMDRSAIPLLAPLSDSQEGEWCAPGPECLRFAAT